MSPLQQLLSIASPPIGDAAMDLHLENQCLGALELQQLLKVRDGFWAYESALLVRPASSSSTVLSVRDWNDPGLWLSSYESLALPDLLFFAEDAFGEQFALSKDGVVRFDPETAELEPIARSLHEWAARVTTEYNVLTGYPLAHEWQVAHGPLPPGERLVPKVPFVCGGQFALSNLAMMSDVEGMRFRGQLASQIVDVPDGAHIQFKITDE
jgi:hypothetical protein